MRPVTIINGIIGLAFVILYAYQFYYILVPFIKKEKKFYCAAEQHRFAVLIAARNEENVIGNLIESIKQQTYPSELTDIFVCADNCTDDTAEAAAARGAKVYRRFDDVNIGKGYALNYLLKKLKTEYGGDCFDAFLVFDADNILDPHYIEEMNLTLSNGCDIATSYRNSKNMGDSWVSAGYGLWFLREAKYLNYSRMLCGTSCAVSGTGYMFSKRVANDLNGWPYYLLTEDIEFTIDHVIKGYRIGFCKNAVFFDEQPTSFKQSVFQRMRWAKGYVQVISKYGKRLLRGCARGSFACLDMTLNIMPALFLGMFALVINAAAAAAGLIVGVSVMPIVECCVEGLLGMYGTMFLLGCVTTFSEWDNIYTTTAKKLLYMFTFPIFMITYLPISIAAIFKKVEWTPIAHSSEKTFADIKAAD